MAPAGAYQVPAGLPPAGGELAPLLSSDPLFGTQATEPGPSGSTPPPEGVRVRTAIGQRHGVDLANVLPSAFLACTLNRIVFPTSIGFSR